MNPGSVHEKDKVSPWRLTMTIRIPAQSSIFPKSIDYVELNITGIMFGKLLCRVKGRSRCSEAIFNPYDSA